MLKNLELTAAIRWDDYSDVDSTWNPKIGAKWTVIPSLVLRGTWATAFRAPGLYETSTANASAGFTVVNDPVRCPVTGASTDCAGQVLSINTGNPFIKPETSDTWTVGVIWEPVPGLSGTLDYWSIETNDQITIGSAQGVADNPGNFPAAVSGPRRPTTCRASRTPAPSCTCQTPYQNANTVKTDGIDLDIVWRIPAKDWGTFTTEFQWTHVFNYSQTLGGIEYKYAGTAGNYDVSSGSGTPEDRWNLILGWARGPWNVTGTVRFVSGYDELPWSNEGAQMPDDCLSVQLPESGQTAASIPSRRSTCRPRTRASRTGRSSVRSSTCSTRRRRLHRRPPTASSTTTTTTHYSGATGTQFNLGVRYTFK